MLTKGAVEDLIASHLFRTAGQAAARPPRKVPELEKKIFLSDYELKKLLGTGGAITVPANAILSPLALDWIEFNGIKINRAGA